MSAKVELNMAVVQVARFLYNSVISTAVCAGILSTDIDDVADFQVAFGSG